jgi:hypothetical protein
MSNPHSVRDPRASSTTIEEPSRTDRNERRSRLRVLRGALFFVLGVIVLSYLELGLAEHVHDSTGALYVALASDLHPVLRQWTNATSPNASDPTDRRSLTRVRSSPAPVR